MDSDGCCLRLWKLTGDAPVNEKEDTGPFSKTELKAAVKSSRVLSAYQTKQLGTRFAPPVAFFLLLTFYHYREGLVTRFGFDSIK